MSIPNRLKWRDTHTQLLNKEENKTNVMIKIKAEKNEEKPESAWTDGQGWGMEAGLGGLELITAISAYFPNLSVSSIKSLYDIVKLHITGNSFDTAPAVLNRPHNFWYTMDPVATAEVVNYDDMMNAVTRIDDILYGLPSGETVGTNYYKQIEKCEYNKPLLEEETYIDSTGNKRTKKVLHTKPTEEPPWKWMYIRTKPKGDALNRLGTGSKQTKDNGLIFSILEDIIDLNPFRIGRMFKKNPTDKNNKNTYKNCTKHIKHTDTDIKYFDKYNNELKGKEDIPQGETIEMFSNINSVNKYYSWCLTSIFIILVLIVLYKLLI